MRNATKWILAALACTAAVGCDPFEQAIGGPPSVILAGYTDSSGGLCSAYGCTALPGTLTGSTWTVTGAPSYCDATSGQSSAIGFLWVTYSKLLNGDTIQATTTDCFPNAQQTFTANFTPATPPQAWYTCYSPQSPTPDIGASVIIFLANATPHASGWATRNNVPASGDVVTVVDVQGTVHDKDGATGPYHLVVNIDPDPGTPGAPTFTNVTATSVDVAWTASACSTTGTTSYKLERAPDNAGAPGTWATINTGTGLTFSDTGLTTGTLYWYRVTAVTSAPLSFEGAPSAARSVPAIPAAPTFTAVLATSLTVNWTAAAAAASYTVQRAPDNAGAPGTWADVATGLTGLTFNDTGLTTATTYWYRVLAVTPLATADGGAASVTTP